MSSISTCCALTACVRAYVCVQACDVDATSTRIKKMNFLLPNLVKATGVETLLRFPSSARFDEFPVQGKSFPLRNTINCSLQVELSTDCSAGDERGGPASGKWMEATATEFCRWSTQKKKREMKIKQPFPGAPKTINSFLKNEIE